MPSPSWRIEKSERVVQSLCDLLQSDLSKRQLDWINYAIHNATKLYCDALSQGDESKSMSNTWSPDLVENLSKNPEECASILKEVATPGYKDDYYKRNK